MSPSINPNEERLFAESYQRMAPRMAALDPAELQAVNLDITSSVATALGALPEVRAIRPQIVDQLPRLDLTDIDELEDIAMALSYANTQYLTACAPPDDFQQLTDEGLELRDTLRGEAEQLARRGRINPQSLKELSGASGYKNLAKDLQILCSVLRENWPQIDGKCGTTLAELEQTERVSGRILRSVGLREQAPVAVSGVAENRQRAYTLFVRTYDDVRRAVSFLRWKEGDADLVAPSLWAGRGGRRKPDVIEPVASGSGAPATNASAGGAATGTAPAAGKAAGEAAATAPSTAAQHANEPFLQ
jgi:hypothetical protein